MWQGVALGGGGGHGGGISPGILEGTEPGRDGESQELGGGPGALGGPGGVPEHRGSRGCVPETVVGLVVLLIPARVLVRGP